MKIKSLLAIIIVVCIGGIHSSFGQGLTLYYMDMVPQSMKTNPALNQQSNGHFSLMPIFPNINLSMVNTGFVLSDVLWVQNGKTVITAESQQNMLSKLQDRNYISMNFEMDYLTVGFKLKKKNYFSLNVTERLNFAFDYSKDFMKLLIDGTGTIEVKNQELNLTGTGIRYNHFREYGLGYTRTVNEKLTIGGKFKLLQGMSHFNNEATEIQLKTNVGENFAMTTTSTLSLQVAGLPFLTDTAAEFSASYLTNFQNIGMAVDLGGKYDVTEKLSTSLSITDLGYISWKSDARRYYNNKVEFTFDGIDLNRYLEEGDNYIKELTDSLEEIFTLKRANEKFTKTLIAHIHAGGEYKFNKYLAAGGIMHGAIFKGKFYPSFTAVGKANLGKSLQTVVSYSVLNRSYNNLGFGLALNLGPLQLYSATDNLLGVAQMDYAKNLNVRFGMNILIGYKEKLTKEQKKAAKLKKKLSKKDSDNDGVNDYEDKCPDVKGIVNGCPDKDKDGVADNVDMCPDEVGLESLLGCPDRDGDNVPDKDDECPDAYGLVNGCPDLDRDSVADKDDPCPNEPGMYGKGCPDSDGDGITDDVDACPIGYGDKEHNGCPDTDKDGIYDNDDRCPEEKGEIKYLGCTDRDRDGDEVPDVFDSCPNRTGSKENKGCPIGTDGNKAQNNETPTEDAPKTETPKSEAPKTPAQFGE